MRSAPYLLRASYPRTNVARDVGPLWHLGELGRTGEPLLSLAEAGRGWSWYGWHYFD
jgi:hypothetical protein